MSWLQGVLVACEGNIVANVGLWKAWDGRTALHLFNEIEHVHGRLWTRHTSRENLENAHSQSYKEPYELLWDSTFIRELVLSAMGDLDTGMYHTRPETEQTA